MQFTLAEGQAMELFTPLFYLIAVVVVFFVGLKIFLALFVHAVTRPAKQIQKALLLQKKEADEAKAEKERLAK